MKRSTKKMATFFGILIVLACMFLIPLSLLHGNISLDGLKQLSTSKVVSYTPLESTSFSHLELKEPTFSETKFTATSALFTVLIFLVIVHVAWEYAKAVSRRKYYLELKAFRTSSKGRNLK